MAKGKRHIDFKLFSASSVALWWQSALLCVRLPAVCLEGLWLKPPRPLRAPLKDSVALFKWGEKQLDETAGATQWLGGEECVLTVVF